MIRNDEDSPILVANGGPLNGQDALFSTVQMPPGIPAAAMAIGKSGAKNAALFALEIVAVRDKKVQARLIRYRRGMREKIIKSKIKL